MSNKILIALDESENSLKAVQYVARTMRPESEVTLLSILPDPIIACGLEDPSLIPVFQQNLDAMCALEEVKRRQVETAMERAREALSAAGFPQDKVRISIRKREIGIARDIVREAAKGGYDTLVLGRRGLSGLKELIMGSVSNKVLHLVKEMALVIVD